MRYRQPGDGPIPQRPDYAQLVEEFPGPVAIACAPPDGTITLCGSEETDGHPWAMDVTYASPPRDRLRVRTVRGSIDWPQTIRSVETLAGNMIDPLEMADLRGPQRFDELDEPGTPTSIVIDGTPVPGTRIDRPNRSGIHVEWRGQHVFCVGEAQLVDTVELRTATGPDFARIMAEFDAYVARRRAEG